MGVFCKPLKFVSLLFILIRKTSLCPSGCHNLKFYRLSTWNTATKKCNCKRCKSVQQPMAASADRTVLGERRGLVEDQVRLPIRETVKTGTPSNVQPQSPGESSLLSRRSYRLDYRLEEEVTRSCRDKHGRWANPWPNWQFPSYAMLLRFLLMDEDHSNVPTDKEVLDRELPVMEPYFVKNPVLTGQTGTGPVAGSGGSSSSGLKVTWLGHASVLVEIDGLTVLTDPIFSQRASAVQFMGPKRYRGPPCTVEQLPRVDAVLISHNHYDHLDLGTVASLNRRFGAALRWFAPMGLLSWLQRSGCENVIELDWWEENCVPGHNDVTFVCTPAQHWCKRTPLDDNMVLWGSWSVLGPKHRFFFAGDTGYCPSFQEIGRRFGPFDLAAIPIGAYQPRDVMKGQHVDPEEAVMIHKDVQAKRSVAIHWGTFALAHEFYLEPPLRLREALEKKGLTTDEFFTLNHGETRLLISEEVPSDKIV